MNSNQRSEANNQSNNGGNELAESSSRAFSSSKRADQEQAPQSDVQHAGGQQPARTRGDAMQQGASNDSAQSLDRAGSQTGTLGKGLPPGHESNDVAGGMPKSPGGHHLAADRKMDDDTGLSNTANREPSELDQNERQEMQSNVGRRSDGTPD